MRAAVEKRARVVTRRRERHHAEIGKHGIASADAGNAEKDAAKTFLLRGLLQAGARIGDGDEVPGGGAAEGSRRLGEKIIHQHVRLERRARLAGDDEQGARDIDATLETPHLLRVGGIEHMKRGIARRGSEALGQHLGAEARSAHAQEQHVGEIFRVQLAGEFLQRSTWRSSFFAMSSQPSQCASSPPVHSVASLLQSRRVLAFEAHASRTLSTSRIKDGGSAKVCSFKLMPSGAPLDDQRFMRPAPCRRNRVRTRRLARSSGAACVLSPHGAMTMMARVRQTAESFGW